MFNARSNYQAGLETPQTGGCLPLISLEVPGSFESPDRRQQHLRRISSAPKDQKR